MVQKFYVEDVACTGMQTSCLSALPVHSQTFSPTSIFFYCLKIVMIVNTEVSNTILETVFNMTKKILALLGKALLRFFKILC